MILKYDYWWFKNALSKDDCQKIIDFGLSKQDALAITGRETELLKKKNKKLSNKEISNLKKVRNSNVSFLDDQWLYELITPYVAEANNRAEWNFDIDWNESFQFTKYKLNQHYDWHQDGFVEPYKSPDPNFNNKIRKISTVVFLSDQKKYKGGEFMFYFSDPRVKKSKKVRLKELEGMGSILVFPSSVWHTVKPVIKGTRYSLVLWSIGPKFK